MVQKSEYEPKSNTSILDEEALNKPITRRGFIRAAVGSMAAGVMVTGCSGSAESGEASARDRNISVDKKVDLNPVSVAESQLESGPGEGSVGDERLVEDEALVDAYELPRSEALYSQRVSPDDIRIARISEPPEEYIKLFHTVKGEVFTGGELDVERAIGSFLKNWEAGINTGCDVGSISVYINDSSPQRYLSDMANMYDLTTVRGIAGYSYDRMSDGDVVDSELYKVFRDSAAANRRRFFENATREGGNLNETIKVSYVSHELINKRQESDRDKYEVDVIARLENDMSVDNPPQNELVLQGEIPIRIDVLRSQEVIGFSRNKILRYKDRSDEVTDPFFQLGLNS